MISRVPGRRLEPIIRAPDPADVRVRESGAAIEGDDVSPPPTTSLTVLAPSESPVDVLLRMSTFLQDHRRRHP
ncbi:uncharacterized protein ARMOST_11420 [Armillaria ostoyae]|uniref:Uncharacterized protein n=1 Tax=Armillaria ostoyae TaxID=47428 RepID=A0A284RH32_ARMOS|nr:uncharacterized protein ARMOST_11420 [Armillaria ostoyae]